MKGRVRGLTLLVVCQYLRPMISRTLLPSAFLIIGVFLATGCGPSRSYELHWKIGCAGTSGYCNVESAKDCSALGFDTVVVEVSSSSPSIRSQFSCYSPVSGPVGFGPDLPAGPITLSVSAQSAGGQLLSGPITVNGQVPSDGYGRINVELPRAKACSDGVDNDGDGAVDLNDAQCTEADDDNESE